MAGALLLTLGLLFASLHLLRRMQGTGSTAARGLTLRVLKRVSLGPKQGIALIQVGPRLLVISTSEGGSRMLVELSGDERRDALAGVDGGAAEERAAENSAAPSAERRGAISFGRALEMQLGGLRGLRGLPGVRGLRGLHGLRGLEGIVNAGRLTAAAGAIRVAALTPLRRPAVSAPMPLAPPPAPRKRTACRTSVAKPATPKLATPTAEAKRPRRTTAKTATARREAAAAPSTPPPMPAVPAAAPAARRRPRLLEKPDAASRIGPGPSLALARLHAHDPFLPAIVVALLAFATVAAAQEEAAPPVVDLQVDVPADLQAPALADTLAQAPLALELVHDGVFDTTAASTAASEAAAAPEDSASSPVADVPANADPTPRTVETIPTDVTIPAPALDPGDASVIDGEAAALSAEARRLGVRGPVPPQVEVTIGQGGDVLHLSGAVGLVVLIGAMTLLPALFLLMTSFTRILIVLHFLRPALGTQTTPPGQILVALAILLTGVVMNPVLQQAHQAGLKPYLDGRITQQEAFREGVKPFREFMLVNTREKDLAMFSEMSGVEEVDSVDQIPTVTVVSAFVTSELRAAFQMGFVLFLPFVVVDLIVASVLMSLGMFMLPPMMVSLPFKLLLFVLADGWTLVVRNLVASFH